MGVKWTESWENDFWEGATGTVWAITVVVAGRRRAEGPSRWELRTEGIDRPDIKPIPLTAPDLAAAKRAAEAWLREWARGLLAELGD